MQRLLAADALELAVFDNAQQLLLHQPRGIGQFVQEQGAAVGALEPALVGARCAGERPGFVAEQFALEQRIGDGRAVHLQIVPFPPVREVMQALGDQFLARAALADDEHRLFQGRDLRDSLQNAQECGRFAEQPFRFGTHVANIANSWRYKPPLEARRCQPAGPCWRLHAGDPAN